MAKHSPLNGPTALRRIDWRFLLPTPPGGSFQHLVVLGGPADLLDYLLEVRLAHRVSRVLPQKGSIDALIVLHDAKINLKDAAGCLVPGGILYWEIDRRSPASLTFTPNRSQHSLRSAGLIPTQLYLALPDFTGCKMYLPLDAPGALEWYVTTLFPAITPLRRVVEMGLRACIRLKCQLSPWIAWCYSVTAVAGPQRKKTSSILGDPKLPLKLRNQDLLPLLLTEGGDRVIILPFDSHNTQPVAVLKVPRLPSVNNRTENEQATLEKIRSLLSPELFQALPLPLGFLHCGEITVGIENYIPGCSILRSSSRWGAALYGKLADLKLAATWLSEFHAQVQVKRTPWGLTEISEWIEAPLSAYCHIFGTTADEERLFEQTRKYANALIGAPFPIVWRHRDFNVWNVLRTADKIKVIDWEGARLGPSLCDLLHFVTHWHEITCHLRERKAQLRGFHDLFLQPFGKSPVIRAVHEVIIQYMVRIEIDPRFLPLLLVYTWVELALSRWDQQQALREPRGSARDGNRNFPFIGILAEHAEQIFGTTIRMDDHSGSKCVA